ncbi:MAG: hypothetical protein IJB16_02780, partial [Clostridia bacterium]|nr:hypothetical protein [Clostridia bacterium]
MIFNLFSRKYKNGAGDYSIPCIRLDEMPENISPDLKYLYDFQIVDNSLDYLGHPDSVLFKDGSIMTVYPSGHGKGAIRGKISTDGGLTYAK